MGGAQEGKQGKQRKRPRGPEVPHRWDGGGGGSGEAAAGLLVALPPQGVSCARLENHGRESYFPFQSPSFYSSKGKISAYTENLTHLQVPASTAAIMARNPAT